MVLRQKILKPLIFLLYSHNHYNKLITQNNNTLIAMNKRGHHEKTYSPPAVEFYALETEAPLAASTWNLDELESKDGGDWGW